MSDVSIFVSAGKRFAIDLKVHGIGCLIGSFQFEVNTFDWETAVELTSHVDAIVALLSKSQSSEIRSLACSFKNDVDMSEYAHEVVYYLVRLAVNINSK